MSTTFPTQLDSPRSVTSSSVYDVAYMQSVDDQIQGLGRWVVQQNNSAFSVVYPKLDPGAGAIQPGYAVALRQTQGPSGETLVVLATSANITAGAVLLGVAIDPLVPGQRGRVAVGGTIPSSISGLGSGSNKFVRANGTTGLLERVASFGGSDIQVGIAQTDGAVVISPQVVAAASSGSVTMVGDVTGPSNANVVGQASGVAGVFSVLCAAITFAASLTAPTISQTQLAGSATPANGQTTALYAQAGQLGTGAANNSNGGDAIVGSGAAGTGGSGTAGSVGLVRLRTGGSSGVDRLVVAPTTATWSLATVQFDAAQGTPTITQAQSTTGAGQPLSLIGQAAKTGSNAGGGSAIVGSGAGDGTSAGTTTLSLAGTSASSLSIARLSSWTASQTTHTTDAACADLLFQPQRAFATATLTNRTPGSLVVDLGAPTNGSTAEARLVIKRAGISVASLGPYESSGASYSALYLLPGGTAPGALNYSFLTDGINTFFNAPGAGSGFLQIGGINYWSYTAASLRAAKNITATIGQDAQTTDVSPPALTVAASSAWSSAVTNLTGATLNISSGTNKDGATLSTIAIAPSSMTFTTAGATLGQLSLVANSPTFDVNASRGGFQVRSNFSTGYILLQTSFANGNVFIDTANLNFRDNGQSSAIVWALSASGTTSMAFASTVTSAQITQSDLTTASGTGAPLTIRAQNETGTTSTGGQLNLSSGSGTSNPGIVSLLLGGTNAWLMGPLGGGAGPIQQWFNVTTPPSATPTGSAYVYVSAGAIKAKGSSGTVTTVAVADPHCQRCGRDFAIEHQNDRYGHQAICVWCLVDALHRHGVAEHEYVIHREAA